MRKLSRKTKVELLVGKVVVFAIQSLIGTGLVLGFFYVLGLIQNLVLSNLWLLIPMALIALYLISKEI